MTEGAARAALAPLGDAVVMWRGSSLAGNDVDLLVAPGRRAEVERALEAAGFVRDSGKSGDNGEWASAAGDVVLDLIAAERWPRAYPRAGGVIGRARREDADLPPVAAPEDRLLIFAADAVAGRPAAKMAAKLRPLAADPAALERAKALARAEGATALAAIAADPDALGSGARRDALPYSRALAAAARSPRARAALATRLRASAARLARRAQKMR